MLVGAIKHEGRLSWVWMWRVLLPTSVTRLGHILEVLATNILSKVAQIFGDFWGYLEALLLSSKLCCGNVLGKILINWPLFIPAFGHTATYLHLGTLKLNQYLVQMVTQCLCLKKVKWCFSWFTYLENFRWCKKDTHDHKTFYVPRHWISQ